MNIIIPVDENDYEEAAITSLDEVKYWLFIEFDEGKTLRSEFFLKRDDIKEWVDIVIVKSDKEYIWPFIEENLAVLVAPFQRSVEDIMEAFLFKELHDLNV